MPLRIALAAALLSPLGCAAAPPPPPASVTIAATPDTAIEATTVPAAPSATPAPAGVCDASHVWDAAARACRLFPGGGNGYAGCSLAKAPPNGERCVTGTHWEPCDCRCDAPKTKWNAASKRCE